MKSIMSLLSVVFVTAALGLGLVSNAQAQDAFTGQGTFALSLTSGDNEAGEGIATVDQDGNIAGSLILNLPAPDGGRQVVPAVVAGTQTVNADGTGTADITLTLPDGSSLPRSFDFVIRRAKKHGNSILATETRYVEREASLTGKVAIIDATRLPD